MKIIFMFITTMLVQQACSQNLTLKVTGDLSKGYVLNVFDKTTKKQSSVYEVHDFIVEIKDTNNQAVTGIDGRKVYGLTCEGDTLKRSEFMEAYGKGLPPGKYNLVFTNVICVNIKTKYEKEGGFMLPNQTITIVIKE
jgi:hypothetical protein